MWWHNLAEGQKQHHWHVERTHCNLNRPSIVNPAVLDQIPQKPTIDEIGLPPTLDEIKKTISQTHADKVPRKDVLPIELYNVAGPETLQTFNDIVSRIWETEIMPNAYLDATIVSL